MDWIFFIVWWCPHTAHTHLYANTI